MKMSRHTGAGFGKRCKPKKTSPSHLPQCVWKIFQPLHLTQKEKSATPKNKLNLVKYYKLQSYALYQSSKNAPLTVRVHG
jgi:hypothetical protein